MNAALASAAALLEMAGSAAVLARRSDTSSSSGSLLALGFVTLTCQVLQAGASLLCIVALPPPEASGRVSLLRDVFGLSSSSSGVPEPTSPTRPDQPLLADGAQPASPSRLHCRRQNPVEQEAASLAGSRVGAVWFDEPTRKFLRQVCRAGGVLVPEPQRVWKMRVNLEEAHAQSREVAPAQRS